MKSLLCDAIYCKSDRQQGWIGICTDSDFRKDPSARLEFGYAVSLCYK